MVDLVVDVEVIEAEVVPDELYAGFGVMLVEVA